MNVIVLLPTQLVSHAWLFHPLGHTITSQFSAIRLGNEVSFLSTRPSDCYALPLPVAAGKTACLERLFPYDVNRFRSVVQWKVRPDRRNQSIGSHRWFSGPVQYGWALSHGLFLLWDTQPLGCIMSRARNLPPRKS